MKNILKLITLSAVILSLVSLNANASNKRTENFEFLELDDFEVDRPYIEYDYTHLRSLADKGDELAYYEGGLRYYYGFSRPLSIRYDKNYLTASRWFYEASIKGHAMSSYFLGVMYLNGQGVEKNYKTAVGYFSMASKKDLIQATYMLGQLYYQIFKDPMSNTTQKEVSYKQSLATFKIAANQNFPYAFHAIALIKMKNDYITRWLIKESDDNFINALNHTVNIGNKGKSLAIVKEMAYYKMPSLKIANEMYKSKFAE